MTGATTPRQLRVAVDTSVLFRRASLADCIVSLDHHDFPARRVVDGAPRGELCGIVWIAPHHLPSLSNAAPEARP